ncbi:MAG: hypothetical protein HYV16_09445 [Gammaproteobacteria bacterium]|nr:hypothetical protein [Gammaproteobacteria bacterium]
MKTALSHHIEVASNLLDKLALAVNADDWESASDFMLKFEQAIAQIEQDPLTDPKAPNPIDSELAALDEKRTRLLAELSDRKNEALHALSGLSLQQRASNTYQRIDEQ